MTDININGSFNIYIPRKRLVTDIAPLIENTIGMLSYIDKVNMSFEKSFYPDGLVISVSIGKNSDSKDINKIDKTISDVIIEPTALKLDKRNRDMKLAKAWELRKLGYTYEHIAKELKVDRHTAIRYVKEMGTKLGEKFTNAECARIRRIGRLAKPAAFMSPLKTIEERRKQVEGLMNQGYSTREISRKLKISHGTTKRDAYILKYNTIVSSELKGVQLTDAEKIIYDRISKVQELANKGDTPNQIAKKLNVSTSTVLTNLALVTPERQLSM